MLRRRSADAAVVGNFENRKRVYSPRSAAGICTARPRRRSSALDAPRDVLRCCLGERNLLRRLRAPYESEDLRVIAGRIYPRMPGHAVGRTGLGCRQADGEQPRRRIEERASRWSAATDTNHHHGRTARPLRIAKRNAGGSRPARSCRIGRVRAIASPDGRARRARAEPSSTRSLRRARTPLRSEARRSRRRPAGARSPRRLKPE